MAAQDFLNKMAGDIMLKFIDDKRSIESIAAGYDATTEQIQEAVRFFFANYEMPNKRLENRRFQLVGRKIYTGTDCVRDITTGDVYTMPEVVNLLNSAKYFDIREARPK